MVVHGRKEREPGGTAGTGTGRRAGPDPGASSPASPGFLLRRAKPRAGMRGSGAGNEPRKAQTLPTSEPAPLPEQDMGDEAAAAAPGTAGFLWARDAPAQRQLPPGTPHPSGSRRAGIPIPPVPSRPAASAHRGQAPLPGDGSAPAPADILQESPTNMSQRDLGAVARQMNLCRNVAFVIKPPVHSA